MKFLKYNDWPSELKVIRGTNSCIFIIMTLQLFAACQIRLASDSISRFISKRVFGRSSSPNDSKKTYLLRGISVLIVSDAPKRSFLALKSLLFVSSAVIVVSKKKNSLVAVDSAYAGLYSRRFFIFTQ